MAKSLREPVIGLTHCIGTGLAITALVLLVVRAGLHGTAWHVVSYSIFGTGLVLLYTFSTLYHWLNLSEKGIKFFRKMDHIMIFVLIAATYTPICLVPLRGGWGWSFFGVVWGLAIMGILLSIFWIHAPRWFSTSLYILLGWIVIIGFIPLAQAMPLNGLLWLFLGGLLYTIGGLIYNYKKPDPFPGIFGYHGLFHIFVVFASITHFIVMYFYVISL
ncbi:hemolysin III family protein [candidate division KSB1 bacterium]|nr:hemolysin III family protein [candidate division KSB1 bacterium]